MQENEREIKRLTLPVAFAPPRPPDRVEPKTMKNRKSEIWAPIGSGPRPAARTEAIGAMSRQRLLLFMSLCCVPQGRDGWASVCGYLQKYNTNNIYIVHAARTGHRAVHSVNARPSVLVVFAHLSCKYLKCCSFSLTQIPLPAPTRRQFLQLRL